MTQVIRNKAIVSYLNREIGPNLKKVFDGIYFYDYLYYDKPFFSHHTSRERVIYTATFINHILTLSEVNHRRFLGWQLY